ncbi:hypothetical protein ACWIGI_41235 [Nocardia sp. NPDC055321]
MHTHAQSYPVTGGREFLRMRSAARAGMESAAVFVAAAVAVLAIMLPISYDALSSTLHLDLMVFNVPRAMAMGAFLSVVAAMVLCAFGSARVAAWTALTALIAILANHLLLLPSVNTSRGPSMTTLNFVDALLAGVLLGALAVAVWSEQILRAAYLFGAFSANLLGDLTQTPDDAAGTHGLHCVLRGALPVWILGATVIVLGYFAGLRGPLRVPGTDFAIRLAPIMAALIVYPAILLTSASLATTENPVTLIVAPVIIVLAAAVAAFILPGRDGVLLLLLTGFAAVGSLVTTLPRSGWIELVAVLGVVAGLLAGLWWPRVLVAAGGVVLLGVGVMVSVVIDLDPVVAAPLGCVALGVLGGFCLGSAVPVRASSAVVGLAVLLIPSAGIALSDRTYGHLAYSPAWYRTTEVSRSVVAVGVTLAVAVGCALMIALLLSRRTTLQKR